MKTNYDTSTQGVNLELSCFYDSDLSHSFFEDDIERIGKTDDFFYISWGEYSLDDFFFVQNTQEFRKAFEEDYHEITDENMDDLVKNYSLDADFPWVEEKYPSIEVRGYSQWDYAKVYYNPECLNERFWAKEFREYLHHLFYDAPVYCRLQIDGEELYFDEYMKNTYEYDKDDILHIARDNIKHDKKEYILQWLGDNLPEHPEYL